MLNVLGSFSLTSRCRSCRYSRLLTDYRLSWLYWYSNLCNALHVNCVFSGYRNVTTVYYRTEYVRVFPLGNNEMKRNDLECKRQFVVKCKRQLYALFGKILLNLY